MPIDGIIQLRRITAVIAGEAFLARARGEVPLYVNPCKRLAMSKL